MTAILEVERPATNRLRSIFPAPQETATPHDAMRRTGASTPAREASPEMAESGQQLPRFDEPRLRRGERGYSGLGKRRLAAAQANLRLVRAAWNLWRQYPQATQTDVAAAMGQPNSTKLCTLLQKANQLTHGAGRLSSRERCRLLLFGAGGHDEDGALDRLAPAESPRDDVDFLPSETELAIVRGIYTRLDESTPRGRGRGSSKVVAYRLAAKSDDGQVKTRISDNFRAAILGRATKSVPPSWGRLLDVPASVLRAVRDDRSITAVSISTPRNRTYVSSGGKQLPLQPGVIFEADDGTLNFYATIPWPFGGDKCSDNFGVKLGRWQLLAVADVASEHCVAADIVCRSLGQYRGEDSAALLGRTMLEVCEPGLWRLERVAWECKMVREAMELCRVPVINAWHAKQKNVIERFFDRLWTPASLIPGHVGRDRDADKFKQVYDLVIACQDGRRNPADYFLTLTEAAPRVYKAIEFVNTEPMESRSGWGNWVPQERFKNFMAANPRPRLDGRFRVFFSREQREWRVRQCCVGGSVNGPLIKFPTYFQCAELWEFEGCRVKCYFDPYAETVTGTIVLLDAWRDYPAGHVIARDVPALELPPQAMLAEEWDDAGSRRSLAIRKQLAKAVRTEMWNWLGSQRTEVRTGIDMAERKRTVSAGRDLAEGGHSPQSTVHSQSCPPRTAEIPWSRRRLLETTT